MSVAYHTDIAYTHFQNLVGRWNFCAYKEILTSANQLFLLRNNCPLIMDIGQSLAQVISQNYRIIVDYERFLWKDSLIM